MGLGIKGIDGAKSNEFYKGREGGTPPAVCNDLKTRGLQIGRSQVAEKKGWLKRAEWGNLFIRR
jgi:hypothetical protein